ncbi:MAG: hypothetical protein DMG59_08220 [Acidobacteria bacterium]|nr:MAG: hypothetical protein DMG59_08220 [Acidobacteriota bacterium]
MAESDSANSKKCPIGIRVSNFGGQRLKSDQTLGRAITLELLTWSGHTSGLTSPLLYIIHYIYQRTGAPWRPMLRLYGFSFLKVLLLVCLPGAVAEAQNKRIPLILSTDVGNEIDDQWTIVYTLLNPLFDVRGIVSAHAPVLNPPAAHTSYRILVDIVENRLRMLQHPPLFEGASLPLEGATPRRNAGVDFIIEQSKSFSRSNRLNVLAIGAVTDVASAILIDPSIAERIKVVDMGFQDWPDGVGLFNIDNDVRCPTRYRIS